MNKALSQWTRKDFESLPYRSSWNDNVSYSSIVIVPAAKPNIFRSWLKKSWYYLLHLSMEGYYDPSLHDSGYRLMDFVAVDEQGNPFCRLSGSSDVIHLDGIGGYGLDWITKYHHVPMLVPPSGWTMGTNHQVVGRYGVAGIGLSSFEFFCSKTPVVATKGEILPPELALMEGGVNEGN